MASNSSKNNEYREKRNEKRRQEREEARRKDVETYLKRQENKKQLVGAVIYSDYQVRNGVEQDINNVESLEEVDRKRHLVLNMKRGPLLVATYDYDKKELILKEKEIERLIPNDEDPLRKFVEMSESDIHKNIVNADATLKKKVR